MRPDVIVIGLGAVGAATTWQLARRGLKVMGIDRFQPPHSMGSSHGQTRITREAVGEGDQFIPLVQRSDAIWAELEAAGAPPLAVRCGALIIGTDQGRSELHGCTAFVAGTADAARRCGIAHEILTPAEVRHRFPAFDPAGDDLCYFEPGAGFLFPERCIAAQLAAAESAGATLHLDEQVLDYAEVPGGVRVTTDKRVIEAGELVVAAGAWSPGLTRGALAMTTLYRQVLHWLQPVNLSVYKADRCPVFIWAHGRTSDDTFYGFPLVPGAEDAGVKIAREQYRHSFADPDLLDRTTDASETEALFADHLAGRMQGLSPVALKTAVCMYTSTPDAGFVLDRVPGSRHVTVVSACSGHGFKHSAAVGEQVAGFVLDGSMAPPEGFRGAAGGLGRDVRR